jgi:outer membrane protein
MKTKLIALALTTAATVALPTAAQAQRVAPAAIVVVDTQRIYSECAACRAAQPQLQALLTQIQTRQQQLGQPIQAEAASIQQAAEALRNATGAARTTGEQQLQQRVQALRQREESANQELAAAQQNFRSIQAHVLQQINARLNPAITQVMNQRGANIAMDRQAVLDRAQSVDVTDAVMAVLNQQLPTVSVTPLPQPAQPQQPATTQPQPPRSQGR